MKQHWLITYQQLTYGRDEWQIANSAIDIPPAKWLFDAYKELGNECVTVLLFAIEITMDEHNEIKDHIG